MGMVLRSIRAANRANKPIAPTPPSIRLVPTSKKHGWCFRPDAPKPTMRSGASSAIGPRGSMRCGTVGAGAAAMNDTIAVYNPSPPLTKIMVARAQLATALDLFVQRQRPDLSSVFGVRWWRNPGGACGSHAPSEGSGRWNILEALTLVQRLEQRMYLFEKVPRLRSNPGPFSCAGTNHLASA